MFAFGFQKLFSQKLGSYKFRALKTIIFEKLDFFFVLGLNQS